MYNFYLNERVPLHHSSRIRKLLLIMKLTTIILITVILHVSATSMAQKVTLKTKDAALTDIFDQIRTQTGYDFALTSDALKGAKPVTINVTNEELRDALIAILKGQNLDFSLDNKIVVIKPKEPSLIDKAKALFAQVTISGRVQDETGQPMVGVTVAQKGTNNATPTDSKGSYNLTVSDNNSIVTFSFIGYETVELAAKDIPNGSVITLKASPTKLQEVVVNKGYYTERRELSTGDVGILTSKEIQEQPVSDPIQALIGRIAGLDIVQTSGVPGAYATVRIRGQNSIANGNDPLYIIDGVPFSSQTLSNPSFVAGALGSGGHSIGAGMSPFNALNPADIEDIQVLKDADATAIYGSRGANGVILVTTKKGQAGAVKVDVTASQGAGQVDHTMDLLNTQQYLQMRHEAFKNDGLAFPNIHTTPTNTDYDVNGFWDTTRYTNWQKVLIGNMAKYTNIQANVSGGNANTQFLVGTGYNRNTTVFPGDYADKKVSVHTSIRTVSPNQKFHLDFTASYVIDNNNIPNSDLTNLITLAPDAPAIYNADGSLNWQSRNGSATWTNPLANTARSANSITNNLMSSLNLGYEFLPGLKLNSSFGYTHDEMSQTNLQPSTALPPPNNTNPNNRSINLATNIFQNWIIEPTLNYSRKIAKGHLEALIGTTFQQNITTSFAESASGFAADALLQYPAAATTFS